MSSAVNKPTNVKQKEQDINQKLQLYGIYSAFAQGKAPSNKQVDVAMNSALESRPLKTPSNKLSPEGKYLVNDLRDAIEKAKILLLTKNEGNLIQDFIWQCQGVTGGNAQKPGAPVDKETAKQHGNEALDGLRTLGTLLITNGQFRKLLNDAVIIARDIAGDAATNAAGRLNPSEDQLAQIDQPAEDNTWHETPDFQGYKQQAKDKYAQAKAHGKEATTSAQRDAELEAQRQPTNDDAAAAGAGAGAQNLQSQISQKVPEEHKQKGREQMERAKNYLDEKVPKERREQTIWRLKKTIVEIQGHQDYQRAIETLLRLAENYSGHAKSVGQDSKGAAKGAHSDDGLAAAEADLKILIERFANSTSMDDLIDSINVIYRDAEQDPELRDFFRKLDTYIRKCLKEQGFVMQDAANEEFNQLYDQGRFLLRERYKNHTNRVLDEIKFFARQFDEDPQNKAFAASMNKLFLDLGNDENGKPQFKPHLLKDLGNVILPGIFENIRYVPIPRIEYTDKMADAVIENLVIEGDNLAPNVFEFGSDNYFRWGRKQIANKNKNKVMMSVSGIQMDLRDVSYYIKKKEGFPSITDKGVMDIFLGGTGFSFKVAMETADPSDKDHFFKVNKVTVDIKHMDIKIKQSKYKLLFSLVKPLLKRVMNPILQKVISKQIEDNVAKLDAFCYDIHQDVKRAEAEAKRNRDDPQQLENVYKRYYTAFQSHMAQTKQKKEEKKEKAQQTAGQTNVVMTMHESMFPNIALPGGISTKATEYKDLAMKGDKWESPVFSIGSARESSNLPKVAQVTRKPHSATPAQLASGGPTSGGFGSTTSGPQVNGSTFTSTNTEPKTAAPGYGIQDQTTTTLGTTNPVLTGQV